MLMKSSAVACIAAFFVVGCGATEEDSGADDLGTQEQPIIWICEPSDIWVRTWYTNFNRTTITGRDYCCNGTLTKEGSWGNYYVQASQGVCGPIEVE